MSLRSSSRVVDGDTQIPDEYDNGERMAKFFLYTRPLRESAVLREAEDIQLQHWAIIAVFQDESIRTIDADDVCGKLLPSYKKDLPDEKDPEYYGKYWKLIELVTTPKKLHKATKENPCNNTDYSIIVNNCQKWVKTFAGMISSELASALQDYKASGEVSLVQLTSMSSLAFSRSTSISSSRIASVRRSLLHANFKPTPKMLKNC